MHHSRAIVWVVLAIGVGLGCRTSSSTTSVPARDSAAEVAAPVIVADATPTSGPDIADVGVAGESRSLVAVAGKITVFDFWAPWCEPCKGVAAGLAELEASHGIAVRKLEIADVDDPASVAYLNAKGFGLPHLKVYGVSGNLLGERSGGVFELLPWVKGLVEKKSP